MALSFAALQQPLHTIDVPDPIARMKTLADLRQTQQSVESNDIEIQNKRKAQKQALAVEKALMDSGGDIEKALPEIMKNAPELGMHYQEYVNTRREKARQEAIQTSGLQEGQDFGTSEVASAPGPATMPTLPQIQGGAVPTLEQNRPSMETVHNPAPAVTIPGIAGPTTTRRAKTAWDLYREKRRDAEEKLQDEIKLARERQKAELEFSTTNPPQPAPPHTVTTAEGVMQWNPVTQKWFKIGERPPNASALNFSLTNPKAEPDTVKYIADQVEDNPQNWNLAAGNKTLQNQIRDELTTRGRDVNRLTAATRQLGETADSILPKIDTTIKKLDDPKFKANLGPVMGRWNEFLTGKVGTNDPDLAQLRATIGLIQTGTMRAHVGARGSAGLLEKFEGLADSTKMDADTLKGSLTGIRDFLKGYSDRIHKREEGVIELERGPDGKLRPKKPQ